MRRVARHLFTLCSAVSLVLCLSACVLWVRSYEVVDGVRWVVRPAGSEPIEFACFTRTGAAHLIYNRWGGPARARPTLPLVRGRQRPIGLVLTDRPDRRALGFAARLAAAGWGFVSVPFWFVALATGLPPAAWKWRRERQQAAAAADLCKSCGYDLRASPERCPECGAPRAG